MLRDEELPGKIVLCRLEVFGEEIGQVDIGVDVGYDEFTIAYTVADPMKSHINSFGSFLFYTRRVVRNTYCTSVVAH